MNERVCFFRARTWLFEVNTMDELIIAVVFTKEAIWNPAHPLYKNVGVLKKLWLEVANEVNKDGK